MFRNDRRGAISIFLCIITAAIILLTGVLIDFARVRAAEAEAKEALDMSMRSTLAGYDKMLKDMYGLFALAENDPESLKEELQKYYSKTLMLELGVDKKIWEKSPESKKFMEEIQSLDVSKNSNFGVVNLYDFIIDDIRITPIYNLTEDEVIRSQILEYMKYRAPKELAGGFIETLLSIKEQAKAAEPIKKKNEIDRNLNEMGQHFENLNTSMDGIKKFEKFEAKKLLEDLKNKIETKLSLQNQINQYNLQIASINTSIENLIKSTPEGGTPPYEAIAALSKQREDISKNLATIAEALSRLTNEINTLRSYIEAYIGMFTRQAQTAVASIDSIKSNCNNISNKIEQLNSLIKSDDTDIAKSIKSDAILKGKKVDAKKYTALREELNFDSPILKEITIIAKNANDAASIDKCIIKVQEFKNTEIGKFKTYVTKKISSESQFYDFRKNIESSSKSLSESSTSKNSLVQADLASGQKKKSPTFDTQDTELGWKKHSNALIPNTNNKKITNLKGVDLQADSSYCDKLMDNIAQLGSILENQAITLRDEVYINEYIVGMFKNSVDVKKKGNIASDLTGRLFSQKSTRLNSELEYIINGSLDEGINEKEVKLKILYLRFAANMIHILTDPEKMNTTLAAAEAVAGFTIIGAPILQGILVLSWAMAESFWDIKILEDGGVVPLIKTKNDWILDSKGMAKQYSEIVTKYAKGQVDSGVSKCTDIIEETVQTKTKYIGNEMFEPFENMTYNGEEISSQKFDDILLSFKGAGDSEIDQRIYSIVKSKIKTKKNEFLKPPSQDKINWIYNYQKQVSEEIYLETNDIKTIVNTGIKALTKEPQKNASQIISEQIESGFNQAADKNKDIITIDEKSGVEPAKNKTNALGKLLALNYKDYLRLFLITVNSKDKLNRTMDLIQLNMRTCNNYQDFTLSECNTYLRADTTVSIKYMFITKIFSLKSYIGNEPARHRFRLVQYLGY